MKIRGLTWFLSLLVAFCMLFPLDARAVADQEEGEDIFFCWAFGAITGPPDSRKLIAVKGDMILKTGDGLKMYVELRKKCFVYLIYHDSQGELHLLFPYDLEQYSTGSKMLKQYYIPKADWFELDEHTGHETFHLLASAWRLVSLERLIKNYGLTEPAKKNEIAGQILDEIRRLRLQNRELKAFAERPVRIVGSFRGTEAAAGKSSGQGVSSLAVEVSAKTFYSKTFTIDHRQ